MDTPFTFRDRAVTLRFYEEDPVELRLYLGDALEEKIAAAVGHYDAPHTLEEDVESFRSLVGAEAADQLLERLLKMRIAAVAQRGGEADHCGLRNPHVLPQLGRGHEHNLVIVRHNTFCDAPVAF